MKVGSKLINFSLIKNHLYLYASMNYDCRALHVLAQEHLERAENYYLITMLKTRPHNLSTNYVRKTLPRKRLNAKCATITFNLTDTVCPHMSKITIPQLTNFLGHRPREGIGNQREVSCAIKKQKHCNEIKHSPLV